MKLPRLAEVNCTPINLRPGDRVVVRARGFLTEDSKSKLRKTVERWAGSEVEVLVLDDSVRDFSIEYKPSIGENSSS